MKAKGTAARGARRPPSPATEDDGSGFPFALKVVLGVLLVAGLVAGGLWWKERTSRQLERANLLAEAQKAIDLRKHSEARVLLARALEFDPEDPETLLLLGEEHLALDQISDAITVLEKARGVGGGADGRSFVALGNAYRRKFEATGDEKAYRHARSEYQLAAKIPQFRAQSLEHLGMLELTRHHQDADAALVPLETLLAEFPDYEPRDKVQELVDLLHRAKKSQRP